jgi:hypothetical protein
MTATPDHALAANGSIASLLHDETAMGGRHLEFFTDNFRHLTCQNNVYLPRRKNHEPSF